LSKRVILTAHFSRSEIMPADQSTEALPNAADREQLKTIAPVVVTACPGLKEEAHAVASEILKKHGIGQQHQGLSELGTRPQTL
jgi:hypothetical protein